MSSLVDFVLNQDLGEYRPYGSAIAAKSCTLPEISRTPDTRASIRANPFAPDGPFRACPPCPTTVDFQFPERHCASVGVHDFMLSEEIVNMNAGVPDRCVPLDNGGLSSSGSLVTDDHGNSCEEKHTRAPYFENPSGKNHSWVHLGVEKQQRDAKSKSNKASSRLARKERMDRIRRTSLFHSNRGVLYLGEGGGVGSTRSQNSSLFGGQSEATTAEQENSKDLQFHLQKELKPSDAGALDRIGIFKKDAESSLGSSRSQNSSCFGGQSEATIAEQENLRDLDFLLQKELKPSDVGALGRIVIPKKDAESSLPRLIEKEGIVLVCEDYDTGEKMMLRFRYWPNNKSRMYLLQNTGGFVKAHHLRQYDKMLLYRNTKLGTYIIRARKGRSDLQDEDVTIGRRPEIVDQNGPEEASSAGAFSFRVSNAKASKSSLSSGVEVVELLDPRKSAPGVVVHRTDLMSFADLPHVTMGEVMENLMTFPMLEFVDVESALLQPSKTE